MYTPETLAYRPQLGLTAGGRHPGHPVGPAYQISGASTTGGSTAGSSGLGQLPPPPHQYAQPSHFPYAAVSSREQHQSTYNPATTPFQSRQNIPYSVLQSVPTYLNPSGLPHTVGYVTPTSTMTPGIASFTNIQQQPPPTGSTTGQQATSSPAFPNTESYPPVSQGGAQAPPTEQQQTNTPTQQQGWNQPPNYPQ